MRLNKKIRIKIKVQYNVYSNVLEVLAVPVEIVPSLMASVVEEGGLGL